MAEPDHEIFDLLIERGDAGYRARVLNSPAGNAAAELGLPISEQQLESFLFRVGRPRRIVRRGGSSVGNEVRKFGEQLFDFLFPPPIRACLQSSLVATRIRGASLRIQMRLSDVPELADLPWEFLYEREANHFCLSTQTPVVRFLEVRQPLESLRVAPPLRVLVVISSPTDWPRLDVEREWEKLMEATGGATSKGLLRLDRLETARLARLNRHLRSADYHVLHFIGHGDFDEDEGTGELHFEDDRGRAARVTANQLAAALRDHRSLRLVVLNACEGARTSRRDPFTGTAQTLIANGIPTVVAMQFEITDEAAITFASEFYSSLALGDPVDKALSEARKVIFFDGNPLEWATPVLYLRAGNARIFDVPKSEPAERLRAEQIATRETHQRSAVADGIEDAQREVEERARREAELREAAEREAAEKALREAEEKAKREAERAKREAEEKAKREAEEKAKREAERAKREAEERAIRQAEEQARREVAEQRARREAALREAEEKAKREAERAKREAEEKARREVAEQRARREARGETRREAALNAVIAIGNENLRTLYINFFVGGLAFGFILIFFGNTVELFAVILLISALASLAWFVVFWMMDSEPLSPQTSGLDPAEVPYLDYRDFNLCMMKLNNVIYTRRSLMLAPWAGLVGLLVCPLLVFSLTGGLSSNKLPASAPAPAPAPARAPAPSPR